MRLSHLHALAVAVFSLAIITLSSSQANAASPKTINYQGRLTDPSGAPVPDTFLFVTYRIYDSPTGGSILWDSGLESIITKDGLFSATFGTNVTFPLPASVFSDTGRYLGITVGGDAEISPRVKLGSTPYTRTTETVALNSITSPMIAPFTIVNNDIADNAVESFVVQDNSIKAIDLFDEPGIASNNSSGSVGLTSTSMVDIATVTITTPAPGYIYLQAKAYVVLTGTKLTNYVDMRISETAGGSGLTSHSVRIGNEAYFSTASHRWPAAVHRVYFKSAGAHTFRLKAGRGPANGTATVIFPTLTAIYIPTSYGTVQTVTSNPGDNPDAKAVIVNDESGIVPGEAWDVDLRYYEMRAREASIKALEAEKQLRRARSQQLSKHQ